MFEEFPALVHTRLQTFAKVLNSLCHSLLGQTVSDLLQCGSKFRDRRWLFIQLLIGF